MLGCDRRRGLEADQGVKPDVKVLELLNSEIMTGFGCSFKFGKEAT
jgi:hypothetical protein